MPQLATKAIRAASYARISTEGQGKDEKHGYARQRDDIERYATKHNFELIAEYRDVISGTTTTREGFDRLKTEIGRYDAVIISSVDRLARNMAGAFRLLSELLELGVELHSADMGVIDIKDDSDIMNFTMRAMSAHLQHSSIRKNTYNARIARAEKGFLPSGIKLYGYLSAKARAYEHPERGPVLKRMYSLAASGVSFRDMGALLNTEGVPAATPVRREKTLEGEEVKTIDVTPKWHTATIGKIIRNPAYYTGLLPWGRFMLPIPPLVSEELWHKAQRRQGAPERLGWPLTGHLRCGYCGTRMSGIRFTAKGYFQERYRCQGSSRPVPDRCTFGLSREKTEARFETYLRKLLADPKAVAGLLRTDNADPEAADKLAVIEAESTEAFKTWRRGIISADELAEVRRELTERRAAIAVKSDPTPHPVEAYLDVLAELPTGEILETLPLVATFTREGLTFGVE